MNAEEQEFARWVMTPPTTARMLNAMRPYTGRMAKPDRHAFIEIALRHAFHRRHKLNPERESVLQWWENCLRDAAASRRMWGVWTGSQWMLVSGKALGRYA